MSISVLAGLGNPGGEYDGTRHNVGFQVIDALAARESLSWSPSRHANVLTSRWNCDGRALLLVKPQSYVNESGFALRRLLDFHKLSVSSLAVIYDDLTLDVARIKVTVSGSAGGHNGVQSLLDHLENGFVRFRIGIGPRKPPQIDLKDFVLGKIPAEDRTLINSQISKYLSGLDLLVSEGVAAAMNQLNRKTNPNEPDQEKL
ncbi:MAG TPA: aminoacyl-tRNA hydrolase [Opitutaceae bacterium]|nr:aminoacyl-tRNA hydrolase [Opitutaceae bacterium]